LSDRSVGYKIQLPFFGDNMTFPLKHSLTVAALGLAALGAQAQTVTL
jgi:hypothetical protein